MWYAPEEADCSATFDELNKYFTISRYAGCIRASTGTPFMEETPGEAVWDEEGKQTMRVLGKKHEHF